jgi:hypothetical protein
LLCGGSSGFRGSNCGLFAGHDFFFLRG